MTGRHSTTLRW